MNINKLGYKKNSPFKNRPYIDIEGNSISTKDVEYPLLALPNNDKPMIMIPGKKYKFPNSTVVREIPLKQAGGFIGMEGMSGETTVPVSPFINLKDFIKKYKKQYGGVVDYMTILPEEAQQDFANEFNAFDRDTQKEIVEYLKGGYYQGGGSVPEYNRKNFNGSFQELEDDETLVTSDGQLQKITGKKHKDGGEQVSLPNGTRIYSEYLKPNPNIVEQVLGKKSKKKMSYADLSKKFPTKDYLDVLKNSEDEYKINTAKIKLANNLAKLDTIFYAQEQDKQNKDLNNYKCGGTKKYQLGGNPRPSIKAPARLKGTYYTEYDLSDISNRFILEDSSDRYDIIFDPVSKTKMYRDKITGTYDGKDDIIKNLPYKREQLVLNNGNEYEYQYPRLHTEPSPTVSTGVVLNLRNDRPIQTYDLPEVEIVDQFLQPTQSDQSKQIPIKVRGKQSIKRTKPKSATSGTPVIDSEELVVPLPLDFLPSRGMGQVTSQAESRGLPTDSNNPTNPIDQAADMVIETNDDKSYPGKKKWDWSKFGISSKLAGTVADIGLALSDKLNVSEPTLYDRRKYPLFTRFVDFDDKEVQRMYSKNIDQIQNSNLPEQVKQAQISELTSKYQDYQAKTDYANLQRYEQKREADTNKLQRYIDYNIDQKVTDIESYREKKARVDYLRDQFKAQRKSRVVNSLKNYADYVDQVSYINQTIPNYSINPITGKIVYKSKEQSNLTQDILSQYQQRNQPKVDLGMGAQGQVFGDVMIITDKEGKVTTVRLDQEKE